MSTTSDTVLETGVEAEGRRKGLPLEIVLFSGGSGTGTIASAMLRNPDLALTVVINAYDDGHSTGRLRRFIPGMLGPSDVRKNINRMMPRTQDRRAALRYLSDHRLPKKYPFPEGMRLVLAVAEGRESETPDFLQTRFELLSVKQARVFERYFQRFYTYAESEAAGGNPFDFDDCALGNILFAGCYLDEERDFNRAVNAFSRLFEIQGRILNVTRGENLFLMARTEDGSVIRGEADLVSRESSSRIHDLFLIDEELYRNGVETGVQLTGEALARFMESGQRVPEINPEVARALKLADMIIYGPGTQHSSLLPSYLTRGIAEAIAANKSADKVFISNIRRDVDIQQEDASELTQKFLSAMRRFFLQKSEQDRGHGAGYIPFDPSAFEFPAHDRDGTRLGSARGSACGRLCSAGAQPAVARQAHGSYAAQFSAHGLDCGSGVEREENSNGDSATPDGDGFSGAGSAQRDHLRGWRLERWDLRRGARCAGRKDVSPGSVQGEGGGAALRLGAGARRLFCSTPPTWSTARATYTT